MAKNYFDIGSLVSNWIENAQRQLEITKVDLRICTHPAKRISLINYEKSLLDGQFILRMHGERMWTHGYIKGFADAGGRMTNCIADVASN